MHLRRIQLLSYGKTILSYDSGRNLSATNHEMGTPPVLYCTVLYYCTVMHYCNILLYCIVLYYFVLYSTVLNSIQKIWQENDRNFAENLEIFQNSSNYLISILQRDVSLRKRKGTISSIRDSRDVEASFERRLAMSHCGKCEIIVNRSNKECHTIRFIS